MRFVPGGGHWLTANAGYDPKAAIRFAERRRQAAQLVIFQAPTHERWAKRLIAIREEAAQIAEAQSSGTGSPLD